MTALKFDPNKSFEEHMNALRKHLTELDPELASVLSSNLDKLSGEGDAATVRTSRAAFNKAVVAKLDALLPKEGSD